MFEKELLKLYICYAKRWISEGYCLRVKMIDFQVFKSLQCLPQNVKKNRRWKLYSESWVMQKDGQEQTYSYLFLPPVA